MKNIGPVTSREQKKVNVKNNVVASMEGLECSKLAENIINRKVSIFYIETVLHFFLNFFSIDLTKIFFGVEKKS